MHRIDQRKVEGAHGPRAACLIVSSFTRQFEDRYHTKVNFGKLESKTTIGITTKTTPSQRAVGEFAKAGLSREPTTMPRPLAVPITWTGQSYRESAPSFRPDMAGGQGHKTTKSPARMAAERRIHASRQRLADGMLSERSMQLEDPTVIQRKEEALRKVQEAIEEAKRAERDRLKQYRAALQQAENDRLAAIENAKRAAEAKEQNAWDELLKHGLVKEDFKLEEDLRKLCFAIVHDEPDSVAGHIRVKPEYADVLVCGKATPLLIATCCGRSALAVVLLASGATVDKPRPSDGKTPLQAAIEAGPKGLELAMAFVDHGADINRKAPDGRTPLLMAAMACDADHSGIVEPEELSAMLTISEALLDRGVKDVDAADSEGVTPLAIALTRDFVDLAKMLRSAGASDEPIMRMEEMRRQRARRKHEERIAAIKIQSTIRRNQEKKRFRARMQARAEETKRKAEEEKEAKAAQEAADKKAAEEAKAKPPAAAAPAASAAAVPAAASAASPAAAPAATPETAPAAALAATPAVAPVSTSTASPAAAPALTPEEAAEEIRKIAGAVLDAKAGANEPDAASPAAATAAAPAAAVTALAAPAAPSAAGTSPAPAPPLSKEQAAAEIIAAAEQVLMEKGAEKKGEAKA